MAKKEPTRREVLSWAKAKDRERKRQTREHVKKLAAVMAMPRIEFFAWELEEISRMVWQAYGRMKIGRAP